MQYDQRKSERARKTVYRPRLISIPIDEAVGTPLTSPAKLHHLILGREFSATPFSKLWTTQRVCRALGEL